MANPFTDPFNSYGYSLFNNGGSRPDLGGASNSTPAPDSDMSASDQSPFQKMDYGAFANGPTNLNGNTSFPNGGNFGSVTPQPQWTSQPDIQPTQPTNAWAAGLDAWKNQNQPPASGALNPAPAPGTGNLLGQSPLIPGTSIPNPNYFSAMSTLGPLLSGQSTGAPPPSTGSPFGANPFMANPTANNPAGAQTPTTNYNPVYFPTADTANTVAQMLGGTVGTGSMLAQGGGGFTQNQPNYTVTLPDGRVINPGFIAQYYQQYADNPNMLARMVASEVTGGEAFPGDKTNIPSQGGSSFAPFGYPNPTPATNSADQTVARALSGQNANGQYLPGVNAQNLQTSTVGPLAPATPATQAAQAATPAAAAGTPPPAAQTPPPAQSNQTLSSLLAFLNAYSGLGGGAGNPTGINSAGQLGNQDILSMLLDAMLSQGGDQSLYTRQRQYPRFA